MLKEITIHNLGLYFSFGRHGHLLIIQLCLLGQPWDLDLCPIDLGTAHGTWARFGPYLKAYYVAPALGCIISAMFYNLGGTTQRVCLFAEAKGCTTVLDEIISINTP